MVLNPLSKIRSRNTEHAAAPQLASDDLSRTNSSDSDVLNAVALNGRRQSAASDGRPRNGNPSPRIGSTEPMGEGSLKLEHLLLPAEDGTLLSPPVPEVMVDPATPQDGGAASFAPGMVRRPSSDHSEASVDARISRARSSTLATFSSNSTTSRPRSPSFRRPASAANSPVKFRSASKTASGGIASALAMSGAALTAQHGVVFQASQFVPSPPTSAGGRSRATSLENDFDHMQRMDSIESTTDFGLYDDLVGTGYAVASRKRNEEFHAMFEDVGEDDYLIEDYGCALQKEILVQGRLYISEHHICFNANIFGWVTHLVIPFAEVISIEKRTTAFVIPNAIQVATMHARHSFASFLSRDTTYELLVNIWHISHPTIPAVALPDHEADESEEAIDEDEMAEEGAPRKRINLGSRHKASNGKRDRLNPQATVETIGHSRGASPEPGPARKKAAHRATSIPPTIKQYKDTCLNDVFTSSPEKIYNLMFTSQAFMKDFWANNQKLTEIEVHDWAPTADSQKLTRTFSYIKPLSGAVGPKQMKCYITDQNEFVDFDEYVVVLSTTRTPDAPSGGSFCTLTKTCITWDKNNCCRVKVTTEVEWSGRSLLKGVITSSAVEGQKSYHSELAKAMKAYIHKHKSEFQHDLGGDEIEDEVVDSVEIEEVPTLDAETSTTTDKKSALSRYLGLVGNLLEPVTDLAADALDGIISACNANRWVALLVLALLLSNIWTLTTRSSRYSVGRVPAETPQTSDEVARAVKGVIHEYFYEAINDHKRSPPSAEEPDILFKQLEELEARVNKLKGRLGTL